MLFRSVIEPKMQDSIFAFFGGSKPPPYHTPQIASPFGRGSARSATERVMPPSGREVARASVTEGACACWGDDLVPLFFTHSPPAAPRGSPLSEGAKDNFSTQREPSVSAGASPRPTIVLIQNRISIFVVFRAVYSFCNEPAGAVGRGLAPAVF